MNTDELSVRDMVLEKMAPFLNYYEMPPDVVPDDENFYQIMQKILDRDARSADAVLDNDDFVVQEMESLNLDHTSMIILSLWRAFEFSMTFLALQGNRQKLEAIQQALIDIGVGPQEVITGLAANWLAGFITGATYAEEKH